MVIKETPAQKAARIKRLREEEAAREAKLPSREEFIAGGGEPREETPDRPSKDIVVNRQEAGTGAKLPNGQQLFFRDPQEAEQFLSRQRTGQTTFEEQAEQSGRVDALKSLLDTKTEEKAKTGNVTLSEEDKAQLLALGLPIPP